MGIEQAKALERRLGWTNRIRPMVIGAFVADGLAPERRTIVETNSGLKYFVDPLSHFGRSLVQESQYEPETEQLIREHLREGENFLDVGANEGYFSVVAASIVGPGGYVAAVEPQSRLCEIIEINLGLNRAAGKIFRGALGGKKGESSEIFLSPSLNTGYSSLLVRPRFSRQSETVRFLGLDEILDGHHEFAMVKVDVEGFEDGVVANLLPLIERGQIRSLLLDYHAPILHARGVEPAIMERTILNAGMTVDGHPDDYGGFRFYTRK
jgi:FkbM family methyltransferase